VGISRQAISAKVSKKLTEARREFEDSIVGEVRPAGLGVARRGGVGVRSNPQQTATAEELESTGNAV
jgi:hypothetical protein